MSGRRKPPRLCPGRPFPSYAYRPGRDPHPTRDFPASGGGDRPQGDAPPDPANWQDCEDYLYGLDLFNHGYYWEAHEAWEGLWAASARGGAQARFFKGLIALAASAQKWRLENSRGGASHAERALRLFGKLGDEFPCMGLDPADLRDKAAAMTKAPPDFHLVPERNSENDRESDRESE